MCWHAASLLCCGERACCTAPDSLPLANKTALTQYEQLQAWWRGQWLRIAAYWIQLRFKGLPKLAAELPLKSGFNGPTCVGLISFMEACFLIPGVCQ